MRLLKHTTFLMCLGLFNYGYANFDIGIGNTSATGGRPIPSLHSALVMSDSIYSVFSTGSKTKLYYHNAYSLAYYKPWTTGTFIFGQVSSAFGVGATMSLLNFQDLNSTTEEESTEFSLGPAFRAQWHMTPYLYINLEVIWGIRDLSRHLLLHFQDTTSFSLGVSF